MAENYLEIQRLSYHAKQYQLVMLLVFNCINHMELRKFLVSKFEKNILIVDMGDIDNKILWKNQIELGICQTYCEVEMIVNVIVHFHIEIGNFIILIIIIYEVVKHVGKISKNTVVGRII